MPDPYSLAAKDLGLGDDGDNLRQQVDDEERARRKRLAGLGGMDDPAAQIGLAPMQLLGGFRGY